jgi:hypothetical protein
VSRSAREKCVHAWFLLWHAKCFTSRMFKRIAAISFILGCTSAAWFILASTIYSRTYDTSEKLKPGVGTTWGTAQTQRPPTATIKGSPLAPESSRIDVKLKLEPRQKGLLWYSTYVVDFAGTYAFRNTGSETQPVLFTLNFPADRAIYDGLAMEADQRPVSFVTTAHGAYTTVPLQPGQAAGLRVAYRSQGLDRWTYKPGEDITQSRDFQLTMVTNFEAIDFPVNSLSPTAKRRVGEGWELAWRYTNLISGFEIAMAMPEKLQPGPLAGEISVFAPVSLLLFFFVIFMVTQLRGIDLHPMNYFFLATAFFAFHLLLAYLVDHISIHAAFAICSAVSIFLAVSYLRLVTGLRFALVEAGIAQFVYLVLFSYAFFLHGYTGLAVTIGCILTLFAAMQMTGRARWAGARE